MSLAYAGENDPVYIITNVVDIIENIITAAIGSTVLYMSQEIKDTQNKIKKEKERFPVKYREAKSPEAKKDLTKTYQETIAKLSASIISTKKTIDLIQLSSLYITMGVYEIYYDIMAGFAVADMIGKNPIQNVPPQVTIRATGDVVVKAGMGKTLFSSKVDAGTPTVYAERISDWILFTTKAGLLVPKWANKISSFIDDGNDLTAERKRLNAKMESTKMETDNKVDGYKKTIDQSEPKG